MKAHCKAIDETNFKKSDESIFSNFNLKSRRWEILTAAGMLFGTGKHFPREKKSYLQHRLIQLTLRIEWYRKHGVWFSILTVRLNFEGGRRFLRFL